jgi:hypothetical protein
MKELRTDIEIDATLDQVWAILTDFASYPAWNPFIQSIRGEPVVGSKLEIRIAPPDGKVMTFQPTVLNAEPNRELRWLGRVFLPRKAIAIAPVAAAVVVWALFVSEDPAMRSRDRCAL